MYEYKIGYIHDFGGPRFAAGLHEASESLNDLGAQGWEVVSVWFDGNVGDAKALLKRRTDREEEQPW